MFNQTHITIAAGRRGPVGLAACGGAGSGSAGSCPRTFGVRARVAAAAGGTIAVITVDPSNPYWKAEVDTAMAEAKKLGYKTDNVGPQE